MNVEINNSKALGFNRRFKNRKSKNLFFGLLFTAPAILGFLIFFAGPMIASLWFSFTNYSGFNVPKFVGFQNYIDIFSNKDTFFRKSLFVTFYYVILSVPATLIFTFMIAMLMNTKIKGRALFRSLFYLPSIVPAVASAMIWLWLFNPDMGLVNNILTKLHLPTSQWMFSERMVIPTIVIIGLWGSGNTVVIFLAGLQGVPTHLYEAIEVDGGNAFHKFRNVTIPMMTPTIFFNGIMGIIGGFQVFTQSYILTQGGPNDASLFYVYYLYREAFQRSEMGYASALAWILFIIIMIFTAVLFKTSNSWVYYEGGKDN